jgi:hypothetical protein
MARVIRGPLAAIVGGAPARLDREAGGPILPCHERSASHGYPR